MTANSKFIKTAKKEMPEFIKTAIDNFLKKLDSEIIYPRNKMTGKVVESRLLKVVQSREEVYNSVCGLMDMINIDKNIDADYKRRIISGMTTTWHELTKIIVRREPFEEEFVETDDEDDVEGGGVSDDHFSSISKSIVIASRLSGLIIERIALLDDPESVNDEKIEKYEIPSIAERYAI